MRPPPTRPARPLSRPLFPPDPDRPDLWARLPADRQAACRQLLGLLLSHVGRRPAPDRGPGPGRAGHE
jgi:hypothetical protein